MFVKELRIYPIKSCGALQVEEALITDYGLALSSEPRVHDRLLVFVSMFSRSIDVLIIQTLDDCQTRSSFVATCLSWNGLDQANSFERCVSIESAEHERSDCCFRSVAWSSGDMLVSLSRHPQFERSIVTVVGMSSFSVWNTINTFLNGWQPTWNPTTKLISWSSTRNIFKVDPVKRNQFRPRRRKMTLSFITICVQFISVRISQSMISISDWNDRFWSIIFVRTSLLKMPIKNTTK